MRNSEIRFFVTFYGWLGAIEAMLFFAPQLSKHRWVETIFVITLGPFLIGPLLRAKEHAASMSLAFYALYAGSVGITAAIIGFTGPFPSVTSGILWVLLTPALLWFSGLTIYFQLVYGGNQEFLGAFKEEKRSFARIVRRKISRSPPLMLIKSLRARHYNHFVYIGIGMTCLSVAVFMLDAIHGTRSWTRFISAFTAFYLYLSVRYCP